MPGQLFGAKSVTPSSVTAPGILSGNYISFRYTNDNSYKS